MVPGNQRNFFIQLNAVLKVFRSMFRDELIKKIKDKYVEQEDPITDIDDLIDEKEKKFNDGWW